jgi:hypothetical protein
MSKAGAGVLLVAAVHFFAASMVAQTRISSKGETLITSHIGTAQLQVKIRTHEIQNGTADNPVMPPDTACTMSRIPCSAVDALELTVAGKSIFVPRSVFADLADVNDAKLVVQKNTCELLLTGGDASESYIVKVVFNRQRVTYRSLTSGEFPEHPLQETVYHLPD